jgi:hypothetical protein
MGGGAGGGILPPANGPPSWIPKGLMINLRWSPPLLMSLLIVFHVC